MKELSIEEKAHRYDEALKVLHKYDGANIMFTQDLKEEMFPELKESEDEKTKRILHSISSKMSFHLRDIFTEEEFQCFDAWSNAWLEKQGDKVSAIEGFETEFERQVSHLIASAINREHEYNEGYVKWTATALLNFAKHELEKQGEQNPALSKKGAKGNEREIPFSDWSEEDEARFESCIKVLQTSDGYDTINAKWLKNIKERVSREVNCTATKEWSEEDDVKINRIVACLENLNVADNDILLKDIDFLKSLKDRYAWKPSDEQMDALDSAIHCYAGISPTNNREVYALEIMKEQLLKLMEK